MTTGSAQPFMRASEPAAAVAGSRADVRSVNGEQDFADARAVVVFETFFRNCGIVFDLTRNDVFDVLDTHAIGEFHDVFYGQRRIALAFDFVGCRFLEQDIAVAFDQNDVGVTFCDTDARAVLRRNCFDANVENTAGIRAVDGEFRLVHVARDGGVIFGADSVQNLKFFVRVAERDTCGSGSNDAFESACVGDDHAFDVFEDVAADEDVNRRRHTTQSLACERGGIRDGDRFGAAHRGQQLAVQNFEEFGIETFVHNNRLYPYVLRFYGMIFCKKCQAFAV